MDLAPPVVAAPPVANAAETARIGKVAADFEKAFLEVMLGQMFSTVEDSAFGGGEGEQAFKSFLTNAFADSIAKRGGIGLSRQLTHELLKLQGLSEGAPACSPPPTPRTGSTSWSR